MKPIPLGYEKVKTKYGYVRKGDVPPAMALEVGSGDDDGEKEKEPRTGYPELYVHDAPEALLDLPDSGKATIEFKVSRRSSSEAEDEDGGMESSADVCLKILSITPESESKEPEPLKESPRDAFSRWSKGKR